MSIRIHLNELYRQRDTLTDSEISDFLKKSNFQEIVQFVTPLEHRFDSLQKSHNGLVQKKVQIKMKDGSTYFANRWVDPNTGQPEQLSHKKYQHSQIHDDDSKDIEEVHNSSLSNTEKQRKLIALGLRDPKHISKLSGGSNYDAKYYMKEAGIDHTSFNNLPHPNHDLEVSNNSDILEKVEVQQMAISQIQDLFGNKEASKKQKQLREEMLKKYNISIDDKWDTYKDNLEALLDGDLGLRAVMAYGNGGVGKSFTLEETFENRKMIEYEPELDMNKNSDEYDYIKIGGKPGSREIQRYLYEHRNKVIVFDDCDSMWNDDGLINVLKNVLDTSGVGKAAWAQRLPETSKGAGDEVPSNYRFNGRMIFITNLSKLELQNLGASPITESRCASSDLTMNMEQTFERLDKILPNIKLKNEMREEIQDVTLEDKQVAMEALKQVAQYAKIEQLNTRVLTGVIGKARRQRLKQGQYNKQDLAKQYLFQFGIV